MDVHSPQQRSYNMSRIKGKNTKPEEILRKLLWKHGYRYRLHYKKLPGKPDIVFPSRKKVIFVNGCFWHKHDCKYFKWPQTNTDFWKEKITGNVTRDNKNYNALSDLGWGFIVVWECELKEKDTQSVMNKLISFLNQ